SEASRSALQFASGLALPAASHLHVVSVIADPNIPVGTYAEPPLTNWQAMEQIQEAEQEYARRTVQAAAEVLARDGLQVTTALPALPAGSPLHRHRRVPLSNLRGAPAARRGRPPLARRRPPPPGAGRPPHRSRPPRGRPDRRAAGPCHRTPG